ncbi:TRAP transporter large permease [Thermodesulfobacteriota bacterium]
MSPIIVGVIGFVLLFILVFSCRIPIGIAMALIGFLGFVHLVGIDAGLGILRTVPFRTAGSYTLSVVPLFVLMGDFAFRSGLSQELYSFGHKWLGRLPGGLAMGTIGACAGFAAICGSSQAGSATMGLVAFPEMKRYGYGDSLASATIAAGGTLGILIPPSIGFILFSILTEVSVGKLFIAGILPGILLAFLLMLAIYIVARRKPHLAPRGPEVSFKEKLQTIKGIWAVAILFALVMGGIYAGFFTPTEAGGVGAFGVAVIGLARKKINWKGIFSALVTTGRITGMFFLILIGAMIFGYFLAITRLPFELSDLLTRLALPRHLILTVILLFLLGLGCVMEALSILLLTIPVIFPTIVALGFDPIWYGIISVIVGEMALITPPVGQNVFILSGVLEDVPVFTIYRGVLPFVLAMAACIVILTIFPQIALFLPGLMR